MAIGKCAVCGDDCWWISFLDGPLFEYSVCSFECLAVLRPQQNDDPPDGTQEASDARL